MTDPTHVIILAQGSQSRMGPFFNKIPKQVLPLSAHISAGARNIRVIDRTIAQVVKILSGGASTPDAVQRAMTPHGIVVIGDRKMREVHHPRGDFLLMANELDERVYYGVSPEVFTLHDPGNSSLKGLARVLDHASRTPGVPEGRTVVLLGDVLYSWNCLEALFCPADVRDVTFAGTSDLGPGDGELWGISWFKSTAKLIGGAIDIGLTNHSKFEDEYQPGQLRHVLWAVDRHLNPNGMVRKDEKPGQWPARDWFVPIDDYTMDVDLPDHIAKLARHSFLAWADDKEHGLG